MGEKAMNASYLLRLISLTLACFAVTNVAFATVWTIRPIEKMYVQSTSVVKVQLESASLLRVQNQVCAVEYKARIVRSFKGKNRENRTIVFGATVGLKVGLDYLLFLDKSKGVWNGFQNVNSRCIGEIPALVFPYDGVFESVSNKYIRDVSYEREKYLDYPIDVITEILVLEERLERLLQKESKKRVSK